MGTANITEWERQTELFTKWVLDHEGVVEPRDNGIHGKLLNGNTITIERNQKGRCEYTVEYAAGGEGTGEFSAMRFGIGRLHFVEDNGKTVVRTPNTDSDSKRVKWKLTQPRSEDGFEEMVAGEGTGAKM